MDLEIGAVVEAYKTKIVEMAKREAMQELEQLFGQLHGSKPIALDGKVSVSVISPYPETRGGRSTKPKEFSSSFAATEGTYIARSFQYLCQKINSSEIGSTFDQKQLAAEMNAAVDAKDSSSSPYRLFSFLAKKKVISRYRLNGRNVVQILSHVKNDRS